MYLLHIAVQNFVSHQTPQPLDLPTVLVNLNSDAAEAVWIDITIDLSPSDQMWEASVLPNDLGASSSNPCNL